MNETVYTRGEPRALPKLSQRKTIVIVKDHGVMFSNTVRNGRSHQIAVVGYLGILAQPESFNVGNR